MAKGKKTATRSVKKTPKKTPKKTTTKRARAAPSKLTSADLKLTVTAAERAGWTATAASLKDGEANLTMPFAVLTGEAIDVAKFARAYWEPARDTKTKAAGLPGLSSAVRTDLKVTAFSAVPVLHEGTAQEILVLCTLVQEAQTRVLLSAKSSGGVAHPRIEGAALVSDLRGAAESYLDDGVETDEDAQLRAVNDAHANDPATDDALASALDDYATFVETLLPGIDGYADFKPAWVTRARELAAELRLSPGTPTAEASADRALLDERNRMATLLARRIRIVRAKARFVFRKHPKVVRAATSLYERRRRSSQRRAKKTAAKAPAGKTG